MQHGSVCLQCLCVNENRLTLQELGYCQVHTEAHESSEYPQGSVTVPLQSSQREHSSPNMPHTPCFTWYKDEISYNFGCNIDYSPLQLGVSLC